MSFKHVRGSGILSNFVDTIGRTALKRKNPRHLVPLTAARIWGQSFSTEHSHFTSGSTSSLWDEHNMCLIFEHPGKLVQPGSEAVKNSLDVNTAPPIIEILLLEVRGDVESFLWSYGFLPDSVCRKGHPKDVNYNSISKTPCTIGPIEQCHLDDISDNFLPTCPRPRRERNWVPRLHCVLKKYQVLFMVQWPRLLARYFHDLDYVHRVRIPANGYLRLCKRNST